MRAGRDLAPLGFALWLLFFWGLIGFLVYAAVTG